MHETPSDLFDFTFFEDHSFKRLKFYLLLRTLLNVFHANKDNATAITATTQLKTFYCARNAFF